MAMLFLRHWHRHNSWGNHILSPHIRIQMNLPYIYTYSRRMLHMSILFYISILLYERWCAYRYNCIIYIYILYIHRICGVPTCLPFIAPASLAACFSLWGHICESLLGQSLLGTLGDCSTFLGFFGPRTFQDSSTSTFWVDGLIHDL